MDKNKLHIILKNLIKGLHGRTFSNDNSCLIFIVLVAGVTVNFDEEIILECEYVITNKEFQLLSAGFDEVKDIIPMFDSLLYMILKEKYSKYFPLPVNEKGDDLIRIRGRICERICEQGVENIEEKNLEDENS